MVKKLQKHLNFIFTNPTDIHVADSILHIFESRENIEDFKIELLEDKKIKKMVNEKVKSLQRFCKGVIWLVTSDTLPSEENSW